MNKLFLYAAIIIIIGFFCTACKKNFSEESFTETINPTIPDFTTQINASVNGFITDENGNAVAGATIKGGLATVTSDQFGYFKIYTAAFAKTAGFVQVTKPGYFTGYRTFLPIEGKQTFIRLQLIPKTNAGNIDAATGGTVTTADGAKITLSANAVVTAATNTAYTGTVNVAAHWLNPSEVKKTQLTMPGDLRGIDSLGYLKVLVTYGMLAVELTGSAGELLQIAPGKKASLRFPIPTALSATAPASINLWYFDETKGLWKQEGNAVKNGNSYDGNVSHFSYWNCDVGMPLVNFTIQIVNTTLNPLSNVPVAVSISGQPLPARIAYTDTSGIVTGMVPANSNLLIEIISPCNERITINTVSTANDPVDLGTVPITLNQYGAVLEGAVTKCNGSPVTDGYVLVGGFGLNSIIEINNGFFSAAAIICPGDNSAIIAYDRETSQQSDVRNITLSTGTNNIGNLQACTASGTDSISITLSNGGRYIYTLPQYLFGGNFYFSNDSTAINAIDLLNGNQQKVQFSFTGPAMTGLYPLSGNSLSSEVGTFLFTDNVFVNVTSYGLIGQYITGSFTGHPFGWPPDFTCTVRFHIQRDQ